MPAHCPEAWIDPENPRRLSAAGREAAVRSCVPLAWRLAHAEVRRTGGALDAEACAAEALFGIGEASASYDPTAGARFFTWAYRPAWQRLQRYARVEARRGFTRLGDAPAPLLVTTLRGDDGAEVGALANVPDRAGRRPAEWSAGQWEDLLRCLCERERAVVRLRYVEGRTLAEVGRAVGVSKERARTIEAAALDRLLAHRGDFLRGEVVV